MPARLGSTTLDSCHRPFARGQSVLGGEDLQPGGASRTATPTHCAGCPGWAAPGHALVARGCWLREGPKGTGRKESGSLARLGDAIRSGIPKTHTHTHTPTHTHCPRRSKLHRTDPRLEALTLLVAPGRPSSVPFLTTIAPLAGPTAVRLHPGSRRDPRGHRHPVDPLRYPGRHRTWRRHRARLRRRRRGALVLDPFLLHTDRR